MVTSMIDSEFIRPDDARCLECRYALKGLAEEVCPECGRAFDRYDASTYVSKRAGASWRTQARPPLITGILLVVLATCLTIYGASDPGCRWIRLAMLAAIAAFCFHLMDLLLCNEASRRDADRAARDRSRKSPGSRWRWRVGPICVVLLAPVFMGLNWPLQLRFALSRPAFEQMRKRIDGGMPPPTGRVWLGLYRVNVQGRENQELLLRTGQGRMDDYGFFYSRSAGDSVAPLDQCDGDWFLIQYPP
ncbi:MAG TPA: hypothetical protein P5081_05080 [Phycisphaerae bacterium]|nr:hypothetical protein [Phycisphaerae bacterium]HRW52238.1 hypothetical protein [Phycisphaerae bacterium]